jgi:DNA-binding SARP family transcriptional activator
MDYRILGPLEVRREGRTVELGGQKQRALLALFLLHANEVVPADRLIEELWTGEPPESAAKSLQVYVSRLRKQLGEQAVLTRAGGYVLELSDGELDIDRFCAALERGRQLRAAGDAAAASESLRQGLALWRGPPLVDFRYEAFAQAEIARLEELHLAALDERVEADLELGRHAELVPELETLVGRSPLRERLRAQLMLSLYRSGRQAEALEAFAAARRMLVEELGIEPGRELRELHQAILRQDATLQLEPAIEMREAGQAAVGEPTSKPEPAAREMRKTVTAVGVSIGTSSERGDELDPEAVQRVTSQAFGEIRAAVERHGGTVETVAADAVTAVFGLPTLHEDDARRAVRAAAELRQRLESAAGKLEDERGARLAFRIGVSTGAVVTGGDAGAQPRATGQPLTLSLQLARAGDPGDIVVDESTGRLARDAIVAEPMADALPALRVVRVVDRVPDDLSRFASPMVGRERERRRLHGAFEQAVVDRSCQLFTILGPAGVGKSRLVREFIGDLAGSALVARGRCLPYGEGITFWPLLEALKEGVGLDDADSPEEARAKLIRALAEEQDAELVARRVAETIGLAEVGGGAEEGVDSVRALFGALARARPLVVVFDDIHWGESTFLDLVEHLADWTRDAPILLVCLARPELMDVRPGWGGGKLNATSALLEPLSADECTRLIENLVGQAGLAAEVETKIADTAEGNPLFVEEMVSMLIDDGVLVQHAGGWIATGDLAAVRVPATIQALLAARLDRLDPEERAVIEPGAVQGKVLYEEAVAELVPEALRARVADLLGSLVRKELIRPDRSSLGGRTYRFRHLLIRDAAYDSIPKGIRAETHQRFARWLEHAAGARTTEYEEIVGYHLERAYRYRVELGPVDEVARALAREAAERLGAAGRRAFARSDAPGALNLISRAVSLLPPEDPLRVDLVPNVRVVQGMEDLSWADKVLTEAVEAAATSGDRRLAAQALVQRGLLRLFTATDVTPQELVTVAEQAIRVFDELDDDLGLARAWRLVAQAHYLDRHAGPSAEAGERALAYARRAGDSFEQREIVEWLGIALVLGPASASDAERRCRRLLDEVAGDPALEANLLGTLAYLVGIQGRSGEFAKLMGRAEQAAGPDEWIWTVPAHFAWIALLRADPAAAEHALRPDYEQLTKIGEKSHFSSITTLLAQAVYGQGRHDEAEGLLQEAENASRPNDVHSQIVARATKAKVLALRGELAEAERLAREAVAFAEEGDFLHSHGEALTDLAEILELAGRSEEAAGAIRRAIALHEQKGNILAIEQAKARLAELSH